MSQFRGLTYMGIPLQFDSDPPDDVGYLVFLTPDQFRRARAAGLKLYWLRPNDKDDRSFALANSEPP